MTATPDFSIRMQVAGMRGLLSEIIAVGALSKHGDTDLMERVREAADTPLPELPSRSCLAQIEEPAGAAPASAGTHITEPYTLAEIEAKIASHDYNADLLLQHAMLLLQPAAAAPQGEYPPLPGAAVWSVAGKNGMPTLGKGWMFSPVQQGNATLPLFTAQQMWAYHDLGRQSAQAATALEAPAAPDARWCPDVCPITGRPFFMWITHHETGVKVPTYGGPFDSYTLPVKGSDGSFECERYDHDRGGWLTDEIQDVGLKLVDDQSFIVAPDHPRYDEIEAFAAAAPQAPAAPSAIATQVIDSLLSMARIVNVAVEDWGETKEDDSLHVIFHKEQADKLEEILDFFDTLPDASPEEGVILSGPSRAARVLLRAMAAPAVDAAPLDVCTDPYNCARCKTHPAHRGDMHHAGISGKGGSA